MYKSGFGFEVVSNEAAIVMKKPAGATSARLNDEVVMEKELQELREKHQLVDNKIQALLEKPFQDQLRLMRLKREKLQLKDAIWQLEEQLYPDLIA